MNFTPTSTESVSEDAGVAGTVVPKIVTGAVTSAAVASRFLAAAWAEPVAVASKDAAPRTISNVLPIPFPARRLLERRGPASPALNIDHSLLKFAPIAQGKTAQADDGQ